MASGHVIKVRSTSRKRGGVGRKLRIWGAALVGVLALFGAAHVAEALQDRPRQLAS